MGLAPDADQSRFGQVGDLERSDLASSGDPLEIEVRSASRASSSIASILFCFSVALGEIDDLVEVGGREHLAERALGRRVAAPGEATAAL